MARSNGATTMDRVVDMLSTQTVDKKAALAQRARMFFDQGMKRADTFEEALARVYEGAIEDIERSRPKRKRSAAKPPVREAVGQESA